MPKIIPIAVAATLALTVLLTWFVYTLGVDGPFVLDDFNNLSPIGSYTSEAQSERAKRFVFGNSGTDYLRSVGRASFLLDTHTWPVKPRLVKSTNILIHLICGLLLFWVIFKVCEVLEPTSAYLIALLTSSLWLLHPLNVSTTLYAIQRLAQLSTLFVLGGCVCFLFLRSATNLLTACVLSISMLMMIILAILSKENGILAIPLIAAIHYVMGPTSSNSQPIFFRKIIDVSVVIGVLGFVTVLAWYGIEKLNYIGRVFTMEDRLAIQPLVLLHYLKFLIYPSINGMSLFHDDYELMLNNESLGYLSFLWVIHAGIISLAFCIRKIMPLVTLGVFIFYIGHTIESTFIQLELMFEHRNYLPGMGVMLIFASLTAKLTKMNRFKANVSIALGVPLVLIGVLSILCAQRAAVWGDKVMLATKWAAEQPYSKRAQIEFTHTLSAAGLYGMAMGELEENFEKFDDVYFKLKAMELVCLSEAIDTDLSIDLSKLDFIPYNVAITRQLGVLGQLKEISCIQEQLENGDFSDLIRKIGEMDLLKRNGGQYSVYLQTAFAISNRLGDDEAADHYIKQLSLRQKTVDTALIAAEHFLTVGDIIQSEFYLKLAKERMLRGNIDRTREIENLALILEHLKNGI